MQTNGTIYNDIMGEMKIIKRKRSVMAMPIGGTNASQKQRKEPKTLKTTKMATPMEADMLWALHFASPLDLLNPGNKCAIFRWRKNKALPLW